MILKIYKIRDEREIQFKPYKPIGEQYKIKSRTKYKFVMSKGYNPQSGYYPYSFWINITLKDRHFYFDIWTAWKDYWKIEKLKIMIDFIYYDDLRAFFDELQRKMKNKAENRVLLKRFYHEIYDCIMQNLETFLYIPYVKHLGV